jgi:hypothetical protein
MRIVFVEDDLVDVVDDSRVLTAFIIRAVSNFVIVLMMV